MLNVPFLNVNQLSITVLGESRRGMHLYTSALKLEEMHKGLTNILCDNCFFPHVDWALKANDLSISI